MRITSQKQELERQLESLRKLHDDATATTFQQEMQITSATREVRLLLLLPPRSSSPVISVTS